VLTSRRTSGWPFMLWPFLECHIHHQQQIQHYTPKPLSLTIHGQSKQQFFKIECKSRTYWCHSRYEAGRDGVLRWVQDWLVVLRSMSTSNWRNIIVTMVALMTMIRSCAIITTSCYRHCITVDPRWYCVGTILKLANTTNVWHVAVSVFAEASPRATDSTPSNYSVRL
jgi:hypothetical protein